jgi:hypothetical protein
MGPAFFDQLRTPISPGIYLQYLLIEEKDSTYEMIAVTVSVDFGRMKFVSLFEHDM